MFTLKSCLFLAARRPCPTGPLFERRGTGGAREEQMAPLRARARRHRAEGMCPLGEGGGPPR